MKRRNGCSGKVRHASKEGACIAAKRAKNCALNVYKCDRCGGWHTGNTRDPGRRADRITQVLEQHERALRARLAKRGKG